MNLLVAVIDKLHMLLFGVQQYIDCPMSVGGGVIAVNVSDKFYIIIWSDHIIP